jgi:hypothetical protein
MVVVEDPACRFRMTHYPHYLSREFIDRRWAAGYNRAREPIGPLNYSRQVIAPVLLARRDVDTQKHDSFVTVPVLLIETLADLKSDCDGKR